jgi:hypothetical protein
MKVVFVFQLAVHLEKGIFSYEWAHMGTPLMTIHLTCNGYDFDLAPFHMHRCISATVRTFMRQKVTSVWQSEVHRILMRTSCARGGATSTSSISSGSPATLLTAAETCHV